MPAIPRTHKKAVFISLKQKASLPCPLLLPSTGAHDAPFANVPLKCIFLHCICICICIYAYFRACFNSHRPMPIQKCALLHFRDTHQRISPPGMHRELAHTLINICAVRWKLHKYWRKQILTAMIQSFGSAQCTLESFPL